MVQLVSRYCSLENARARIVFDHTKGAPIWGIPGRTKTGPVEVVYTPRGVIADDEILRMVEKAGDRTAYTVVTNDRGISDVVKKSQVRVIASHTFMKDLQKVVSASEGNSDDPREKSEGLLPGDVDYWMKEFGLDE